MKKAGSLYLTYYVIIALVLLINLLTLMRFPIPHGDEAWMASRAWEFLQSGTSFGPLDSGVFDRYDNYEVFNPWLSTAIQSIGVLLFGEPSLLSVRFTSMLMGYVYLIAIYWIGFAIAGKQFGLLSILFTSFSLPFFTSSHFGRSDIIPAAFGLTGIAIYLNSSTKKLLISLAGLVIALAFEIHPNAAIFGVLVLILLIFKYRFSFILKAEFWSFIAGCGLGLFFFIGIHILPNLNTYIRLNQIGYESTRTPPIMTGDINLTIKSIREMPRTIIGSYPQIIVFLWLIIRLRKNHPRYINIILVISATFLLGYPLLIRNKFLYYSIYYLPGLSLLIAALFNELFNSPIKFQNEMKFRKFLMVIVLFLPMIPVLRYNQVENYFRIQSQLDRIINLDDVIMGNQLYWFGLNENKYYSWENLIFHQRDIPNSNLEDALLTFKPDILIIDGQLRNFISNENLDYMYFQDLQISKSELKSLLFAYAELEDSIEGEDGDRIYLYRFKW